MLRVVLSLTAALLLLSCGVRSGKEFVYRIDEKENKIAIERSAEPGKTAFEVVFVSTNIPLKTAADFCIGTLERFMELSRPYDPAQGTVRIGPEKDLYRVFIQLGAFSLPDLKNGLLRTGFIQSQWRKWIGESAGKNDNVSQLLNNEKYDLFRITEFRELLSQYCTNQTDLEQVYPFTVSYLLKQVLFISLQEILSRPYRYDQPREADSVFSQLVTIPEALTFTAYLTEKYGAKRALLTAKKEFSTNSWKQYVGEEFHDTEGDFTARLEDREYKGVFQNAEFRGKLEELLKIYNSTTKSTLFKK